MSETPPLDTSVPIEMNIAFIFGLPSVVLLMKVAPLNHLVARQVAATSPSTGAHL